MDPILKWPGGKRAELAIIIPLMPPYGRLVEPFAGGAALYLSQEPASGILNDIDPDLVGIYRKIGAGQPGMSVAFEALAAAWDAIRLEAQQRGAALRCADTPEALAAIVEDWYAAVLTRCHNPFTTAPALPDLVQRSVVSKLARLEKLAARAPLSDTDRETQLATGIIAGFYTLVRDAFVPPDADYQAAAWWFLRELCYGSMFRFNRAGHFNIPYGGASYNRKDLHTKVAAILSPQAHQVFSAAQIECRDFRAFFSVYGPGRPDDFVFLDPPYDTEFSDYGNNAFGRSEQVDLAAIVAGLQAQAMLVIKNTDFVRGLYLDIAAEDSRFHVGGYSQHYGYNVRGRNDRSVEHLLITNYALPNSGDD